MISSNKIKLKLQTLVLFYSIVAVNSGISQKSQLSPFPTPEVKSSLFSSLLKLSHKDIQDNRNLSRVSSSVTVVGGTEAEPNQFPFQISLQVRNYYGGFDHNCGGVIYDATHIITAAHCVRGYHWRNLKVVAGEHEIFNDVGPEQYRDVLGYVFHPGFDPLIYNNDIAIITLDYPLDLNEHVRPLALPKSVREYPETAITCGWGRNGYDDAQQLKLLYVNLDVFSDEECEDAWPGNISPGMMCAGDKTGSDGRGACNGDSGGALICADENGEQYLCGLVSWGAVNCLIPIPTVFTNINTYLDWLTGLLPPQQV